VKQLLFFVLVLLLLLHLWVVFVPIFAGKKTIWFYYAIHIVYTVIRIEVIIIILRKSNSTMCHYVDVMTHCSRCTDISIIIYTYYNMWDAIKYTIKLDIHSPSGHVLGLVTLLRLFVKYFAGRTALFPGSDAVEAHVELLTVVWVGEHRVRHVLASAVMGLVFGACEAIFQFH